VHVANLPRSSGRGKAGPHFCLILTSDADIAKSSILTVAGISSDTFKIDSVFQLSVPRRSGLDGFICCSWLPEINETMITEIGVKLTTAEMKPVEEMVNAYKASRLKQNLDVDLRESTG
jgi:hypothetical protein